MNLPERRSERRRGVPRRRRFTASGQACTTLLAVLFGASGASAAEPAGAKSPVQLDVTNAGSVLYNANNRNSRPGSVARSIDDDWGVFYNRLNVQASTGRFQFGLRLDSAIFYAAPDPTQIATTYGNSARTPFTEELNESVHNSEMMTHPKKHRTAAMRFSAATAAFQFNAMEAMATMVIM